MVCPLCNKEVFIYSYETTHKGSKKCEYYQNHKEEIKAKVSQKYECDCGSICRIAGKTNHEKSLKHQAYLSKYITLLIFYLILVKMLRFDWLLEK
jgi:hypothetical protein